MSEKRTPGLTEGRYRKGGINQFPSQITERPAPPAPMIKPKTASVICVECSHFFDPTDERACFPTERSPSPPIMCPACTVSMWGGTTGWAVWNNCQGVFVDAIAGRKADAEKMAKEGPYAGDDCEVRPVRIYVEPEDRWRHREIDEAEREKWR